MSFKPNLKLIYIFIQFIYDLNPMVLPVFWVIFFENCDKSIIEKSTLNGLDL